MDKSSPRLDEGLSLSRMSPSLVRDLDYVSRSRSLPSTKAYTVPRQRDEEGLACGSRSTTTVIVTKGSS